MAYLNKKLQQLRYIKNPKQIIRYFTSHIKSLEIAITYNCNFKCKGCYAADLKTKEDMSLDTYKKIIKDFKPFHVNLTGGEPLLHSDIYKFINATPDDVILSMVTNGSKLDRKTLYGLKTCGLNTIQISFGYNYPESNLDKALMAKAVGLNVCLSVTNTFANRNYIINAIAFGLEHDIQVLFNTPDDKLISDFDKEFYLKNRNSEIVREDNMFWSGRDICPAGRDKAYITVQGILMPCDRMHKQYNSLEDMRKDFKTKTFCARYK